ncbi:hypothetical protein AURDEDRAFT_161076 [Auricularia subglabra TFB-10046 SS5]|nr:hypothetical protein AURDEDRAFT_161076 [Auricularia subglabra TFB-10046 SS5]
MRTDSPHLRTDFPHLRTDLLDLRTDLLDLRTDSPTVRTKVLRTDFALRTPLRSNVNAVLERHKTSAGASLRVSSISTTASGNVVVVAADPFTAADLLDHAEDIAHAILPDSHAYVGADCDQAWYQVLVNGVSTRVHDVEGLPSGMKILADLNEFSSHKYDWASQPRWLGSANDLEHKTRGSVILAFKTEADALHAIEHSVCIFGQLCSARRFEDVPRLCTCDNCCGLDHTARICTKPKRCGVCGSNDHTTSSHSCDQMECEFYSTSRPAGSHCEHTKLKCPHCKGEHAMRDPNVPCVAAASRGAAQASAQSGKDGWRAQVAAHQEPCCDEGRCKGVWLQGADR